MKPPATDTISELILRRMTTWKTDIATDPKKAKQAIGELSDHLITYFHLHYSAKGSASILPGLPSGDGL